MSMREYQKWTTETAIYPGVGRGDKEALTYIGLGLGEAGEIQGKIKKIMRDDGGVVTDEKREAILKESGDLLWYLARLFDELGTTFEEVSQANRDNLTGRKERGTLGGSGDNR